MKKLSSTEVELEKNVAYQKSAYITTTYVVEKTRKNTEHVLDFSRSARETLNSDNDNSQ